MSHCYGSDGCYGEPNSARLVKSKVVAVATQPRFHDIHNLNEVNTVAQQDTVQNGWSVSEVCASSSTERVHFYRIVMKVSDE